MLPYSRLQSCNRDAPAEKVAGRTRRQKRQPPPRSACITQHRRAHGLRPRLVETGGRGKAWAARRLLVAHVEGLMLCRDVMKTAVFACHRNDALAECARTMRDRNIGFLPVLDDGGVLIGVVTDRDLAIRALAGELAPGTPVSAVMTSDVIYCRPLDELRAAEAQMAGARKSRLVIVDDDGLCAGVISLSDIAQAESLARAGQVLSAVTKRETNEPVMPGVY
jgi:CBS domain-containing protein